MSDLGEDIKEVHEEVGSSFTVIRDAGNISGEYCILKPNSQVTKPFTREFFMEGKFAWDTVSEAGDVLRTSDGRNFLHMNKTPVIYADEIIEHASVLYKCNVSGELQRISGEGTWDANYQSSARFESQRQTCYGLMTAALYGHDMESDEELALLGLENHELYVPHSYGVEVYDRYIPISGEKYMAETVKTRKYDNVDVVTLVNDTR